MGQNLSNIRVGTTHSKPIRSNKHSSLGFPLEPQRRLSSRAQPRDPQLLFKQHDARYPANRFFGSGKLPYDGI
jgi:hypothetical protein